MKIFEETVPPLANLITGDKLAYNIEPVTPYLFGVRSCINAFKFGLSI